MQMPSTSFTSRRPAAGSLPAFSLPPPTADVPSMAKYPQYPPLPVGIQSSLDPAPSGYSAYTSSYLPLHGSLPETHRSPSPSVLTPSPGASDGLSPNLANLNTGSSQGSQVPAGMQYSYSGGHAHGSWPTPGNSAYTVSSAAAPQPSLSHPFARQSLFNSSATSMQQSSQFRDPRSSHSPSTGGEGLPPPPYGDVQHPFQTSISTSGAGGQTTPSAFSTAPPASQSSILSSQTTQPPSSASAPAHVDSYTHTRPPSTPGYYPTSSTPQHGSFPAYAAPPASQHSPNTSGPLSRGLSSLAGPGASSLATHGAYSRYSYGTLPNMNATVLSSIHQPGAQMAMVPGMTVPSYGSHTGLMYGSQHPPQQSERPFKCDQCIQSFSRNHDLKRHKRIHLAVKPFPCTYCSKSFSRKDALKRHRLVKGCEGKPQDNSNEGNTDTRSNDGDENMEVKREH